jgi:hypothetical protein
LQRGNETQGQERKKLYDQTRQLILYHLIWNVWPKLSKRKLFRLLRIRRFKTRRPWLHELDWNGCLSPRNHWTRIHHPLTRCDWDENACRSARVCFLRGILILLPFRLTGTSKLPITKVGVAAKLIIRAILTNKRHQILPWQTGLLASFRYVLSARRMNMLMARQWTYE